MIIVKVIERVSCFIFNYNVLVYIFFLLEIDNDDDESITSEDDEDEASMQTEESPNRQLIKNDTEKQKADALKKQIGRFSLQYSCRFIRNLLCYISFYLS
jgi:hypothetical protein